MFLEELSLFLELLLDSEVAFRWPQVYTSMAQMKFAGKSIIITQDINTLIDEVHLC